MSGQQVRFGPFEANLRTAELRRHGVRVRLHGQPVQILNILLERPGEVVTREEFRARLWGSETFVDFEHGLNAAVNKLRAGLKDSAEHPRYIETVPRHGYRFIGVIDSAVEPIVTSAQSTAVPTHLVQRRFTVISLGVVALVSLLLAGWWWRTRQPDEVTSPARAMLAVLPFENLSGDPEQEFFSDGLTEEMITELGGLDPERLGVIARTSVMHYKQTAKTIRQIARELGVDHVLEGSVRRDGKRVRVSAQLIRASDDTHLWAHSYDRSLDDVLPLQMEIARAITGQINRQLPGEKRALAAGRPVFWQAHEAALMGRYFLERRTANAIVTARGHFEQAIALDPTYALAYVGLADSHILAATYADVPTKEAMAHARRAVLEALKLDEGLADAHAWLGVILTEHDWDWTGAEREFRRAIALNPNFAYARKLYAEHLSYVGRFEEAIAEGRLARRLDPLSIVTNSLVGLVLYRARRYDDAVADLRFAIEMDPNHPLAYLPQGLSYSMLDRHDEAIAALEKGRAVSGDSTEMVAQLALAYGRAGRLDRARRLLQELRERSSTQHVSPFSFALAHAGLSDWPAVLSWLEASYREREWFLCVLKTEPVFDPIRDDPRLRDLLRRLNFPS